MKRLIQALLLAVAVGCGSDSSTSPQTNLSGLWIYNATNIATTGLSCNLTGVQITLTQSGTTFSGSVAAGSLISCSGAGGTQSQVLGGDIIANGLLNGTAVQFDIGTQDIHNVGSLSGNSISGTVTIRFISNGVTFILTGNFTMVKQ